MKKSLFVVGLLFASTNLLASDNDMFVGVEVGNTKANFKASVPSIGYSLSESDDARHQGIKLGKIFNSSRVALSIQGYNETDGVSVSSQAISADYFLVNGIFKPFIGLHLAHFSYEKSGLIALGYDSDKISASDTALGFQFGGLYSINKQIDFEAGYRITNLDATGSNSITASGTVYPVDFVVEDAKAWYVGLNYKF